ncbi:cell division protein ZipA [Shewanella sp. AS1]|uniref:cell division protein ZipA n=1 Tax=Shewanella sp. AS1 TaxID=2907626 RepID=UPI001F176CD6|nr:cell division protein ZipA [Shewanella sp. AS1]MCE9679577.1 cell division protein ZipA [Shewanella sp. AS1]
MENLQLVLFVLGAVAIIAVLLHGFWSIRRQQPKSLKDTPIADLYKDHQRDKDGFDADGIGTVRVKKAGVVAPNSQQSSAERESSATDEQDETQFSLSDAPSLKTPKARHEPVITAEDAAAEQMELGLPQAPAQTSLFEDPVQSRKPQRAKAKPAEIKSDEPKPAEVKPEVKPAIAPEIQAASERVETAHTPEPRVDAELHQAHSQNAHSPKAQTSNEQAASEKPAKEQPLGDPQDVLVLHVVAAEGEELNGAELLPSLLTLNFKFGDMDIFHRHEDNAGTGKVLFSLANMVKPGVFNPDQMEQFTTQGVVLFMTLPCYGDALMNFSNMLNSAYQLVDDLGAELLDGGREPWSEAKKQAYVQRIRAQL